MAKLFPQAGVISSLNAEKAEAKVWIGLLNFETDWCPVATNLLYEKEVELEGVEIDTIRMMDITTTSPEVGSFSLLSSPKGTIEKMRVKNMKFNTLQVGDEVLVVFLNGDPHTPVVTARL